MLGSSHGATFMFCPPWNRLKAAEFGSCGVMSLFTSVDYRFIATSERRRVTTEIIAKIFIAEGAGPN